LRSERASARTGWRWIRVDGADSRGIAYDAARRQRLDLRIVELERTSGCDGQRLAGEVLHPDSDSGEDPAWVDGPRHAERESDAVGYGVYLQTLTGLSPDGCRVEQRKNEQQGQEVDPVKHIDS
jgi:hypothetical protein